MVRIEYSQLARSAELPSHRVSGYLKSCATVCLRQPCLCFVPGKPERESEIQKGRDGSFN